MQKNIEFKFIMSRHSQSTHNVNKTQAKSLASQHQGNYKKSNEYKNIKYDPKLIDLNDIDQNQISQNQKLFGMQSVSIILTSPLNRCLQTSIKLAQGHPNIQIIVQPLLMPRLSSAWSIGRSLKQKIEEYPNLNFNYAQQQQKNWCFQLMNQEIKSKYDKIDYTPESILSFVSEGHAEKQENIMNRIRKFKAKLKKQYLQKAGDKNILIMSHSSILQSILATEINKKGRAVSNIEFQHCQPIFIKQDYLMNGTILSALEKPQK